MGTAPPAPSIKRPTTSPFGACARARDSNPRHLWADCSRARTSTTHTASSNARVCRGGGTFWAAAPSSMPYPGPCATRDRPLNEPRESCRAHSTWDAAAAAAVTYTALHRLGCRAVHLRKATADATSLVSSLCAGFRGNAHTQSLHCATGEAVEETIMRASSDSRLGGTNAKDRHVMILTT
eukprot:6730177-Prymnesium_polylepis.3